MPDVFQLLARPSRRQLLDALRDGERSVTDLVGRTRMSQPSVSKQLRILRESGMVARRSAGRRHLYSIRGRSLREVSEWLSYYERFWHDGLDRMDATFLREKGPRKRGPR